MQSNTRKGERERLKRERERESCSQGPMFRPVFLNSLAFSEHFQDLKLKNFLLNLYLIKKTVDLVIKGKRKTKKFVIGSQFFQITQVRQNLYGFDKIPQTFEQNLFNTFSMKFVDYIIKLAETLSNI